MKKPKKVSILVLDQYKKPMIRINLESINEEKIEPILKKHYMNNLFSENNWGLFEREFEKEFKEIGAVGIQIERLNWEDDSKDFLNMAKWEINIIGDSLLNKYLKD